MNYFVNFLMFDVVLFFFSSSFRWRGGADRFVCADPSQPWTQQCVESVSMFLNVNLNIPLLLFHLLKCVFSFLSFFFCRKLREKMKKQHNGTSRNVLEQV